MPAPPPDYDTCTAVQCACSYKKKNLHKFTEYLKIVYDGKVPEESVAAYLLLYVFAKGKLHTFDTEPIASTALPVAHHISWKHGPVAPYTITFNCIDGLTPLECACGIDDDDDSEMIAILREKILEKHERSHSGGKPWNTVSTYIVFEHYLNTLRKTSPAK